MRIVHVSPTYFDESSVIGGGERYPTELALRMARREPTTLVSFGPRASRTSLGPLEVRVYRAHRIHGSPLNPLALRHLPLLLRADVVHVHQVQTLSSDVAALFGWLARRPVFVTDYGGGGSLVLNQRLPVFAAYRHAIAYSSFGRERLPPALREKAIVVKGGVDVERFTPATSALREDKILFVGRLLPHKGVDYLVEAFARVARPGWRLVLVGRPYHEPFYRELRRAAAGMPIDFVLDADDERLRHEYRTARVTVLPSVHTDSSGRYTPVPELLGLTLLESQACGTPVVCTDAGAMPEFVEDGRTGFVVPQNSAEALAHALDRMLSMDAATYLAFCARCREWVDQFSWHRVVDQHLAAYARAGVSAGRGAAG